MLPLQQSEASDCNLMMSVYPQNVFPWNSILLIDYQTCGTVRIIFIVYHLFAKLLPILTNKRNTYRPGPLGSDLSKKKFWQFRPNYRPNKPKRHSSTKNIRKQNNEARNAVAVIYFGFYCLLECKNIVEFMFPFQNF